tara:strand:- start:332 stop:493 length:162 start_codon:yes stop_codon:yes gene_type:complete
VLGEGAEERFYAKRLAVVDYLREFKLRAGLDSMVLNAEEAMANELSLMEGWNE